MRIHNVSRCGSGGWGWWQGGVYECGHGDVLAMVFGWEGAFPQSDACLCHLDELGEALAASLGSKDYVYGEGWGYWVDVGFVHGSEEWAL